MRRAGALCERPVANIMSGADVSPPRCLRTLGWGRPVLDSAGVLLLCVLLLGMLAVQYDFEYVLTAAVLPRRESLDFFK